MIVLLKHITRLLFVVLLLTYLWNTSEGRWTPFSELIVRWQISFAVQWRELDLTRRDLGFVFPYHMIGTWFWLFFMFYFLSWLMATCHVSIDWPVLANWFYIFIKHVWIVFIIHDCSSWLTLATLLLEDIFGVVRCWVLGWILLCLTLPVWTLWLA